MKLNGIIIIICVFTIMGASLAAAQEKPQKPAISVDAILDGVEKRYGGPGFTARFTQQSTIKAMDITDMAEGKLFIKRPGMMRWEYEKPEKQLILTNADALWVFRPEDNQVMTGSAPDYFGDGKGASFLSDIRILRKNFILSLENSDDPEFYQLKLVPKEKKLDITSIHLSIHKKSFELEWIATYNSYEDETLINLENAQFNQNIDDAVFTFQIPEGADIVQLEK